MKRWFAVAGFSIAILSCQKEVTQQNASASHHSSFSIQSILAEVKDSLPSTDFGNLDTGHWYNSSSTDKRTSFVRIAFKEKDFASDFILLHVDSLSQIIEGKIIHVTKDSAGNNEDFNGTIAISSLNRKQVVTKKVEAGKWKEENHPSSTASMMEEEPAGEQDLPPVVVTSHAPNGSSTGDWYLLEAMFDDDGTGSDDGNNGYVYAYAGGGTSVSNGATTMVVEVEANDLSPISVKDYLACFSNLSDSGATYQISLLSDIPVNGDPSELFNYSSGEVGHTFIQLKKTNGNAMVQQNIGFYPQTSWKSLSMLNVASKIVNNAGHEYNASLTASLSSGEFQSAIAEIQSISGKNYDITKWNCTDFALAVFNASNTGETFSIPKFPIPGTNTNSNTPQAVYVTLQKMKENGNDSYGSIDIPGICGYVGDSHGSCGDDN